LENICAICGTNWCFGGFGRAIDLRNYGGVYDFDFSNDMVGDNFFGSTHHGWA
jgi:hypothetical protein